MYYKSCLRYNYKPLSSLLSLKSTLSSLSLQYRDVFIIDSSYNYDNYISNINNLKHPSSTHIISSYCNYIHNNSTYHFNSLGEFSLNVNPAYKLSINNNNNNNSNSNNHDMILWPDRLYIKGLSKNEIPNIMKVVFKDKSLSSSVLSSLLPKTCIINNIPNTIIVSSTSNIVDYNKANVILKYFQNIINDDNNNNDVMFLLVPEMRGHRLGKYLISIY